MKLPDYTDLGAPPTISPPNAVANYGNATAPGEALAQAGAATQQAGSNLQDLLFKADVTDAVASQYMPKQRELAQEYYSLQGKAAVDGQKDFETKMAELRSTVSQGLTGQAQQQFQNQVLPIEDRELYRASQHAGEQAKVYAGQSNDAALANHLTDFSNHVIGDPNSANDDRNLAMAQQTNFLKSIGVPPDSDIAKAKLTELSQKFDQARDGAVQNKFLSLPPSQQIQVAHSSLANTTAAGKNSTMPDTNVAAAILGQESGNNDNAPTSVDGAVGKEQITPGTFALYAKPGESIVNNDDRAAVFSRMMADYTQKFKGDPERIAVAYFSGPGNVAPAGSPTPWVNDVKDGNGKSVSSYVSDINGRMGKSVGNPGDVPVAANPTLFGQPVSQEVAGKLIQAALTNKEHADKLAKINDDNNFNKTQEDFFTKEHGNQLTWQAIQTSNLPVQGPGGKTWWQDRLNKPADQTDPAVFNDLVKRVNLPDGSAGKITDPKDILGYVGKGISYENMKQLQTAMADPDEMKLFFKQGRDQFDHTTLMNVDGEGEQRAYAWEMATRKAISDGQAKGISLHELIDPTSKNYVGNNIGSFQASIAQQSNNLATKIRGATPTTPLPADKLRQSGESLMDYNKRLGIGAPL